MGRMPLEHTRRSAHNSLRNHPELEEMMENLVALGEFFYGLGFFFIGAGVLWFVSVYRDK